MEIKVAESKWTGVIYLTLKSWLMTIKVRKMNHSVLALYILFSCGTVCAQSEDVSDLLDKFRVVLDESLMASESGVPHSSEYAAAWLLYATARITAYVELEERQPGANLAADDYEIELFARKALTDFWFESRQGSNASPDPYLDTLVEIDRAGFLEEYVIGTFAKPGWTISAGDLAKIDGVEFSAWAQTELKGFATQTLAYVESESIPLWPAVPGEALPDPEQYAPGSRPCSESMDTIRAAMTQWESEAALLRGVPLAADDRRGFLLLLQAVHEEEPYQSNGLTWVANRPGWLSFIAGFCSIDSGDSKSAATWLKQATTMLPLSGIVHLEFAHVLVMEGKLIEADEHVDYVLANSQDRCDLGRAWRRRGYIRFEQGKLSEARSAYQKSLDYEPGNRIALSELQLLETEIVRRGGEPSSYMPPPSGDQVTTECTLVWPVVACVV